MRGNPLDNAESVWSLLCVQVVIQIAQPLIDYIAHYIAASPRVISIYHPVYRLFNTVTCQKTVELKVPTQRSIHWVVFSKKHIGIHSINKVVGFLILVLTHRTEESTMKYVVH